MNIVSSNGNALLKTRELADTFSSAKPFPHIVIDNFFDAAFLNTLEAKFPPREETWWTYDNLLEKKLAFNDLSRLSHEFSEYFNYVNSEEFLSFLTRLSGVDSLIADPLLNGGGLHMIERGGKLDVHEDYNIHRNLGALRKLNVIVYVNSNWNSEWGGHIELWDDPPRAVQQKIEPCSNRMLIFRTDCKSNHGHPHPLQCPQDRARKSLATYYYVKCNVEEHEYHSTIYKPLPNEHTTPELEDLRNKRMRGRL